MLEYFLYTRHQGSPFLQLRMRVSWAVNMGMIPIIHPCLLWNSWARGFCFCRQTMDIVRFSIPLAFSDIKLSIPELPLENEGQSKASMPLNDDLPPETEVVFFWPLYFCTLTPILFCESYQALSLYCWPSTAIKSLIPGDERYRSVCISFLVTPLHSLT